MITKTEELTDIKFPVDERDRIFQSLLSEFPDEEQEVVLNPRPKWSFSAAMADMEPSIEKKRKQWAKEAKKSAG